MTPSFIQSSQVRIEDYLSSQLSHQKIISPRLHDAMRYALLQGGKRLRPLLVYAAGQSVGADLEKLDAPAAAIECIHAYSLVHDDLPAMDNSPMRRGKPSCHIAFDEATAILAGDALQTMAFSLLAEQSHLIPILATAAGATGMVGGQSLEWESLLKKHTIDLPLLQTIHQYKTGALMAASLQLGAAAAGCKQAHLDQLAKLGQTLGLAYQIADDIEDANSAFGQEKAQQLLIEIRGDVQNQLQQLKNLQDIGLLEAVAHYMIPL